MHQENIEQINTEEKPQIEVGKETEVKDLKEKVRFIFKNDAVAYYKKAHQFGRKLMEKYPDCFDYLYYHILGGSTPPQGMGFKKFDFPDNDSVEKFIDDLYEEYSERKAA